jgi:hypothetical protein
MMVMVMVMMPHASGCRQGRAHCERDGGECRQDDGRNLPKHCEFSSFWG